MTAEVLGAVRTGIDVITHLRHSARTTSKVAKPQIKITVEQYLTMRLAFPMNGEDFPKKRPTAHHPNDWAPYSNPAAETGRDV